MPPWVRNYPGEHGLYLGNIRARVVVSTELLQSGASTATAQIWWRRRDDKPELKSVIVTDATGAIVHSTVTLIEGACGIVTFDITKAASDLNSVGDATFFAYYLPYWQSGGGAHLHFHWSESCIW